MLMFMHRMGGWGYYYRYMPVRSFIDKSISINLPRTPNSGGMGPSR